MGIERARRALGALLALFLISGCPRGSPDRLRVVATTTLISGIVQALGGARVEVVSIAPAGMCPGHFDIQPAAVRAVYQAHLVLGHGWEGWLDRLRAAAGPGTRVVTVNIPGNWMVPPVHKRASEELARVLSINFPEESLHFKRNLVRYEARVDSVAELVRRMFAGRVLPRVLAAEHQAEFLRWLGFPVVATYGRPEEFTARELSRLAQVIVDSGVGLVVDNLQSGPDAGRALARAAGISQVTISNFPADGDYLKTLMDNARALSGVLP